MSGQLLVQPPAAPDERHLRVAGASALRGGASTTVPRLGELRFVDQRMFGGLSVSAGGAELPTEIAHIARDPLDPEFDDDDFVRRVRRRSSGIKRQLLDQGLVSGVGNIYADEALWRSRLHGERPGSGSPLGRSASCSATPARSCPTRWARAAPPSTRSTSTSTASPGYFDRSLHAYGREGEPCERCGTPIRRVAFMNRSSYFCPRCQPVPRRSSQRRRTLPQPLPAVD